MLYESSVVEFGTNYTSSDNLLPSRSRRKLSQKKRWSAYGALFIVFVVALVVGVYFGVGQKKDTVLQRTAFYPRAAVSVDAAPCATIGRTMLEEGGSAVDAAIAALLCDGLANAHSMGIGGGFVMTIWDAATKTAHALIAREKAPLNATEDMFEGNGTLSATGGLAVAVPGEIAGYWAAHQKFGKLNWSRLFEPSIALCRDGMEIQKPLGDAIAGKRAVIEAEPSLKEIFWNPKTNDVYQTGDTLFRPVLADTLTKIAEKGADEFYRGETAKKMIDDLKKFGGILSMQDLATYKPSWHNPFNVSIDSIGVHLYTTPAPSSGPLMAFILNIVESFGLPNNLDAFSNWSSDSRITAAQRIIEAFKHAYGKRTLMGDPTFLQDNEKFLEMYRNISSEGFAEYIKGFIFDNQTSLDPAYYGADLYTPDDHGTAHVSVVGPTGDAVAVTSTINLHFGAKIRSSQTGVIFNDEMDDFSAPNITNYFGVPPSPNNFIKPGKIPLSSMCPSIFVDTKTDIVRLVTGAAGGTRITTSVAWVSLLNLMYNETLRDATHARRLHHQLLPMAVNVEKNFPTDILEGLEKIGHNVTAGDDLASVVSIAYTPTGWNPVFDPRKVGQVDGF